MAFVQEEQKKSGYNANLYDYPNFINMGLYNAILYEKVDNHEKRMTNLESELESLQKLIRSNNHMTKDNQFFAIKQKVRTDDNRKIEDRRGEGKLELIVSELNEVEDKKLQIQIVGELVDEIKKTLKEIPKQKNNYRRQMLLMFHEALKQNYVKALFNEAQVKALAEVARICNETFVTKEQYFKMDDILCECDLDMMPDLE
ncbi:MAG: hypothetical protein NC318_09015 [Blautia sp.]|nr:hypothetical protein [Lachnoclostridium sp.]MCM1211730.1 hypothetical protein [Blautia sp.]